MAMPRVNTSKSCPSAGIHVCPETFFAFFFNQLEAFYVRSDTYRHFSPPAELGPRMQDTLCAMCDGRPVILLDDVDWTDEADFIVASERLTVPTMAFSIRECSDIVRLCLTQDAVHRLDFSPMVVQNESCYRDASQGHDRRISDRSGYHQPNPDRR